MELHHKIVEVLKQEFPDLKVPEIQEGFAVALTVSVERMVAEAGDQVKRLQFEYCSETGNFTYFPTLDAMLNRVFDLPEDGPGIVREERDAAKARILPGAFRSAARRCAGLIDAANRMTYSYDMSIADRIECLASYMERNASEKQVSREL